MAAAEPRLFVYTLRAHLREGRTDDQCEDLEALVDKEFRKRIEALPAVSLSSCLSMAGMAAFFKVVLVSNAEVDAALLEELRCALGKEANDEGICAITREIERNPYICVTTEQGRSVSVPIRCFPVPRLASLAAENQSWVRQQADLSPKARVVSAQLRTERMTQIAAVQF
jgi:hypothetical protein